MSMVSSEYESSIGRSRRNNPYKRPSECGGNSHSADIGLQGRSKAKINAGRRWRSRREETSRTKQAPENNSPARPTTPRPSERGRSSGNSMHFVFAALIAMILLAISEVSSASPAMTTMQVVPILQRMETRYKTGEFSLKYVTGDGIVLAEVGRLKSTADGKDAVLVKEGSYSYTSPEGQVVKLSYVADERGFRPVAGDVTPNPPEERQ